MDIKEGLEMVISIFLVIVLIFLVISFPVFIFYYGYPVIYKYANFNIYIPSNINITLYQNQTENIYLPIKYEGSGLIEIIYYKQYNISVQYPQIYLLYGNSSINIPLKISYYGDDYGNFTITLYIYNLLSVLPVKINVYIPQPYINITPLDAPWDVLPGTTKEFYIDVQSNYNKTILIECISNENISCSPSEIIGYPGIYQINISASKNIKPGEYYINIIGEFYNG